MAQKRNMERRKFLRSGMIAGAAAMVQAAAMAAQQSGAAGPASPVSGPAQRSLTLRPTRSPSRLSDPLYQRLRQLHYFHCRFGCYRAERSSSRVGFAPTVKQRLFTAHEKCGLMHPHLQVMDSFSCLIPFRRGPSKFAAYYIHPAKMKIGQSENRLFGQTSTINRMKPACYVSKNILLQLMNSPRTQNRSGFVAGWFARLKTVPVL